jgi:hypothetical protein
VIFWLVAQRFTTRPATYCQEDDPRSCRKTSTSHKCSNWLFGFFKLSISSGLIQVYVCVAHLARSGKKKGADVGLYQHKDS